ncbi:deoxyribodipyrimidine photo-lyase [candidate division KSB1 bacterium]|nr:deoxyribodipyrimidine photo-lyase [candidate division KSB1 bacterium]
MIQKERIKDLNEKPVRNRAYILYWMQQAQRTEYNHALEHAINLADQRQKPLIVFFGITDNFPEANERHYYFMLQGLRDIQCALAERKIKLVVRKISPELGAIELSRNADLVVADRGYLKIQRAWRKHVADRIDCRLVQVESDVIVPVEIASLKEEYAAATLRPKIHRKLQQYLVPLAEKTPAFSSLRLTQASFPIESIDDVLAQLEIDKSVARTTFFTGGTAAAKTCLDSFIARKLAHYGNLRNDPSKAYVSDMSPYLHFGQISPLYIALKVAEIQNDSTDDYLEELIVRRELSMNFCHYNENYDRFDCLPEWAKRTLHEHRKDARQTIYTTEEFENAATHDPYWNAAQKEMVLTGKMHGYMRMYWGKKILEWTRAPEEAYQIALYLNNKYELDGRDPNGFTGVAWCFGKHDRAWFERPIFGKVRYMNANGLRRKFDADAYVRRIEGIERDR